MEVSKGSDFDIFLLDHTDCVLFFQHTLIVFLISEGFKDATPRKCNAVEAALSPADAAATG